jgi:hypothetical protein
MHEQSRIHQQLSEASVREAQQVVIADTAKAHLQERQERLQQIDALRDKVNALAVAFDQRCGVSGLWGYGLWAADHNLAFWGKFIICAGSRL